MLLSLSLARVKTKAQLLTWLPGLMNVPMNRPNSPGSDFFLGSFVLLLSWAADDPAGFAGCAAWPGGFITGGRGGEDCCCGGCDEESLLGMLEK